jgi:hypothetical protein
MMPAATVRAGNAPNDVFQKALEPDRISLGPMIESTAIEVRMRRTSGKQLVYLDILAAVTFPNMVRTMRVEMCAVRQSH